MEQNQTNEPFHYDGHMYISTVSSLIEKPPLKIGVVPGDYVMRPYLKGFVFTKTDYDPKLKEMVHVLATRSGDPGFLGTYHCGGTDNRPLVQLFNKYFLPHIPREIYDDPYSNYDFESEYYSSNDDSASSTERNDEGKNILKEPDDYSSDGDCSTEWDDYEESKTKGKRINEGKPKILKRLHDYNNFPILFFLNFEPNVENLSLVVKYEDKINNIIIWDVIDNQKGKIGIAIKEEEFHCMMGDQMGLAVFSLNATHGIAFGNFYVDDIKDEEVKEDVFYPDNKNDLLYDKCEWKKKQNEYWKKRLEEMKQRNE